MVIRQNRWNRVVRVTFRYDEPHHIWMSHSLPCIICIVSACLSSVPGWWRQSKWAWFPVYSRHSEPRVYRRRPAHRFNDTTQGRSGHRHYCGSVRGLSSLSCICCHTHTHPFNGPLSRTTRVSRYQKVSGIGISWAIFKSDLAPDR